MSQQTKFRLKKSCPWVWRRFIPNRLRNLPTDSLDKWAVTAWLCEFNKLFTNTWDLCVMMFSPQDKFVGPNLDLIETVTPTQSNIRILSPLSFDFWILAFYFLPMGLNTNHCLDYSSANVLKEMSWCGREQTSFQSWLIEEIFPISEGSIQLPVQFGHFFFPPHSIKGKANVCSSFGLALHPEITRSGGQINLWGSRGRKLHVLLLFLSLLRLWG